MFQNITSNYLYLLISIIIFTYLYFTTQTSTTSHKDTNKVLIEINTNIIEVDTNNMYSHLMLIKENLHTIKRLNLNYDTDIVQRTQQLVQLARRDLRKFNSKNADQYEYTHNTPGSRSDMHSEPSKINVDHIITDLEVALSVLKRKTHGHITLTNLHELLKMFTAITHGENHLTYDEIFDLDAHLNANEEEFRKYGKLNNYYTHKQSSTKHTDISQNVLGGYGNEDEDGEQFANDETNILFETSKLKRREKHDDYVDYNTQMFGSSGKIDIAARNGIKHFVPFCNINKLKRENKQHKVFVDSHSRQALRNDYNL